MIDFVTTRMTFNAQWRGIGPDISQESTKPDTMWLLKGKFDSGCKDPSQRQTRLQDWKKRSRCRTFSLRMRLMLRIDQDQHVSDKEQRTSLSSSLKTLPSKICMNKQKLCRDEALCTPFTRPRSRHLASLASFKTDNVPPMGALVSQSNIDSTTNN